MFGPVWSLMIFTLNAFVLGVALMVIFEEFYSVNKAMLRYYMMVGLLPLTLLGMTLMDLVRHYLAESLDLIAVTAIGLLAVFAFALGIGCLVSLRTYRDRLSPGNGRWGLYMLIYVLAGIALPLLSLSNSMIFLVGHR